MMTRAEGKELAGLWAGEGTMISVCIWSGLSMYLLMVFDGVLEESLVKRMLALFLSLTV